MKPAEQAGFPSSLTQKDIQSILQSSAGKHLLKLLNEQDGTVLKKAAEAAKQGKYDKAYEALETMLRGTDASKLADEIKKNYG